MDLVSSARRFEGFGESEVEVMFSGEAGMLDRRK